MKIEKLYFKILKWANNRDKFTEPELFNKFPELKYEMKNWYSNTFIGAANSDNCLMGVYDDKNGSFLLFVDCKGSI